MNVDFFNKKKILVTGGLGFIGSCLVRNLLERTDATLRIIDKLGPGSNLDSVKSDQVHRYKIHPVDLAHTEKVFVICDKFEPDIIIHLAAESHVDRSISGPSAFVESNVVGTFSILEAARRVYSALPAESRGDFRFHHVSTDEVYGSLTDEGYFTEESPYKPSSPYSATKAASDLLVLAWNKTYGLPVTISNCSNNFGPWQADEKLIPTIVRCIVNGESVPVYGDGGNVRDWLFVEDHVEAILACVERGETGETYCVGARCERSNIQVILKIFDIMSKEDRPRVDSKMIIKYVEDRLGHDYRYSIEPSKIETQLRWFPQGKFEDALEETVRWYVNLYTGGN
jgi:dTDP-glucose 4,6-dehydratase